MFLHLGNDCVVKIRDIIGIFDIENTSISKDTKAFLSAVSKNGEVVYVTNEMPKSFVVCQKDNVKIRAVPFITDGSTLSSDGDTPSGSASSG